MAAAYGWDSSTIALLVNLGTGAFIISVWPVCWMVENLSLRPSMIITCVVTTLALAIRCFPATPDMFKMFVLNKLVLFIMFKLILLPIRYAKIFQIEMF